MEIIKELKNAKFIWDEKNKILRIEEAHRGVATLTKIEMFSLARFIIRVSQYLSRKHRKENEKK